MASMQIDSVDEQILNVEDTCKCCTFLKLSQSPRLAGRLYGCGELLGTCRMCYLMVHFPESSQRSGRQEKSWPFHSLTGYTLLTGFGGRLLLWGRCGPGRRMEELFLREFI